jgi:hypothetical protein
MASRRTTAAPDTNGMESEPMTSRGGERSTVLPRLLAHADVDAIALTGGLAIDFHVTALGRAPSRRAPTDLDFVVSRPDAVAPAVSCDFLISHYHVPQPGVPKFLLQLVDPATRLRIDVIPDLAGSIALAEWRHVGATRMKVLTLASIFEHKLLTLLRASRERPVDPKHLRDAELLGALLGRDVPPVAAEALAADVYGGEADASCGRCEASRRPGFPLAPKQQVLELLGW